MELIKNILLALVATVLATILIPIGLVTAIIFLILRCDSELTVKYFNRVFLYLAISIDIWGNFVMAPLFNMVLIKKHSSCYRFGKKGDTISKVIGLNLQQGNLTMIGKGVDRILNIFEKDHSIKAVTNNSKI